MFRNLGPKHPRKDDPTGTLGGECGAGVVHRIVDPGAALALQVDQLVQRPHPAGFSGESNPAAHPPSLKQTAGPQLPPRGAAVAQLSLGERARDRPGFGHATPTASPRAIIPA
jgi:hypothetical protein